MNNTDGYMTKKKKNTVNKTQKYNKPVAQHKSYGNQAKKMNSTRRYRGQR